MRKGEDHLVDELVISDGAGDGREFRIGRHGGDEVSGVEVAEGGLAVSAGECGAVVNVGVVDRRGKRGFGVVGDEFVGGVLFPEAE